MSMQVLNERLNEPACLDKSGCLTMHGTSMPPSDGQHLYSLDGAVDACALFLSTLSQLVAPMIPRYRWYGDLGGCRLRSPSRPDPSKRVVISNVLEAVVVKLLDSIQDFCPHDGCRNAPKSAAALGAVLRDCEVTDSRAASILDHGESRKSFQWQLGENFCCPGTIKTHAAPSAPAWSQK